jgi:hypothetical protein
MRRGITKLKAAAAGLLSLGLVAGGAVAASAGVTPSPSATATPSPNFGYHPKHVRVTPWTFDLQQSDIAGLAVNDVEGAGAIPMSRWTDTQLAPDVDRFSLGGNSVTLLHDPLPVPDVNLRTCTVTFSQPAGRFRIIAGTGTGAGLRSLGGQFDLTGLVSFPLVGKHRYGGGLMVCPLRFLSPGTILRVIESGVPVRGLPAPVFTDFAVQGSADVFRVPVRVPVVPPSYTPAA